jgi:ligand-binding sensor domain-containing protein
LDIPVQALLHKGEVLWVGTSLGLKRLSLDQDPCWTDVDGLSNIGINSLIGGQDDIVWVGTDRGLARIAHNGCHVFNGRGDGLPTSIAQALKLDDDTLWIGTANGLSRFTVEQ